MANPPKGGDAKLRVYPLFRSRAGHDSQPPNVPSCGRPARRPPILEALQLMRKIRLLFAPLLAGVLLVPTLGPAAAGASSLPTPIVLDSNLKIHPLLQYGALTTPTTVVRVIIQQVHVPSTGLLGGLLGGGSTNSGDEQFTVIPAL